MYSDEHLEYFRALISGEDVIGWHPWWAVQEQSLKALLPRAEFLRLKFGKVKHAAEVLNRANLQTSWSEQGLRQAAWANLHPSAVDEQGRPIPELRASAYGGAIGALEIGDLVKGTSLLRGFLRRTSKMPELDQAAALSELEFDAEGLIAEGLRDAGVEVLREIARLPSGNDLLDPAISAAKARLQQLDVQPPNYPLQPATTRHSK